MTEIAVNQANSLPSSVASFVLHWGDMGGQWGVNRSVAQIHALLYLSARAMTAEDIADQLGLARSNVSNSIKELMGWKLVRRVPQLGDRRDHFEAEADLWEMVRRIAAGRKEREIDPALEALERCAAAAEDDPLIDPVARARIEEMRVFLRTMDGWYGEMMQVPAKTLMRLIRLGSRIATFLK
jgi:DNA-binding transcriptional regulator GbsR (MarR family)